MQFSNNVLWSLLLLLVSFVTVVYADDKPALREAQRLLLTGKYAEAEEAFRKLLESEPTTAAIGLAECQKQVGQYDEAAKTLRGAAEQYANEPSLSAQLALLEFERGNYAAAEKLNNQALASNKNFPLAQWVKAELFRVQGKFEQAHEGYQWFVDDYNSQQPEDADRLRLIGLATAQLARWDRLSDQFQFLVNELYPDILTNEPNYWQAHLEAGQLFLEKYNEPEAIKEFKAALVINPNAARVHASIAALAVQGFELGQSQDAVRQALEINPRLLDAHLVQADIHLANFEPQKAVDVLRGALELNPACEPLLGRLAAALAALDGLKNGDPGPRAKKLIDEAIARNPHAGEFFFAMAETFDKLRRFPTAARYYREAAVRMPQLIAPAGQEGMMLMRLGDEGRARKLLDASFEADPFNVRVSNTLKVLEVLDGYETLETEHFIIKFDPQHDKLLAQYAGKWLEEQYPLLCRQFRFEPPQKSLFEIFNKARNTDGHGWFSARMIGLPHVHTIGACAGQMVAMQSPNDGEKFNWARVLKHEFIHVLNLQQTNFNIPHWFTEALATLNEGYPRPQAWNDLLVSRQKANKLFDLDTINMGFIRARNGAEWNLAYCQAELYAEFMLAEFGDNALAKMLSAYADNLHTRDAIERSFGVKQAEFEKRYSEYVKTIVASLPVPADVDELKPAAIEQALKADPKNPELLAKSARMALDRKDYATARRQADAALAIDPRNQLAAYVRARLHLLLGETTLAVDLLTKTLDEAKPQANLLSLLAGLKLKAANYDDAARLYEIGAVADPNDDKWTKALASVYLKANQTDKLAATLTKLVATDADDVTMRKKLAELAIESKDFPAVERWTREALQIDVTDAEIHRMLAHALEANGDAKGAAAERDVAAELSVKN